MIHYETSWTTDDSQSLFCQGWEPEGELRAVVCLVHGLGEHSGRYTHVADFFTRARYAVITFDLRGHGKSGGVRGHSDSFEAFMKDIDLLFQEAEARHAGKPRFLYGHSLGGLLVLNYALRRKPQVVGVIATSPGLHSPLTQQKAKIAFARTAAVLLPKMSLSTGLDANTISRDPAVVQVYMEDPLVHGVTTLAMTKACLDAIPWAFQHASEFAVPLLLVHGTGDQLTYASGSQEFARLVKGDCTLKLWEGLFHETHNEPEKEQVLAYTLGWMDSQLAEL